MRFGTRATARCPRQLLSAPSLIRWPASGARRLTLATLGLIQYIGPTMQLLLGVWLYHEPFGAVRAIGFGLIWAALALYSGHGLLAYWKASR